MGNKSIAGLKHFRSFRFGFSAEDKIKYDLSLGTDKTSLHGEYRLLNLSLSGVAFESDQILDPEKPISLRLRLSGKDYIFSGRLVRGSRDRERRNYFIYGVRWSNLQDINEHEFIESLVYHFKHKRLRKELTNLLVNEVKLDDPEPEDLLSVVIGLYTDLNPFDERGGILETFMLQTKKLFRCEGVRFFEVFQDKNIIRPVSPFQIAGQRSFKVEKSAFHKVILTKTAVMFSCASDYAEDSFYSTVPQLEGLRLYNSLLAPVLDQEQNCVGIIELFNFKKSLNKQRQAKYIQSTKLVSLIMSTLYKNFCRSQESLNQSDHYLSYSHIERSERKLVLIGESDSMRAIRAFIQKHKDSSDPVLISGASGTGKELLAKILHQEGQKRSMPHGVVDIAEWKEDISLKEYFLGTESKVGKFELYSGGTLVLKNIDLLSKQQQEQFMTICDPKYSIRLVVTSQCDHHWLKGHLIVDMQKLLMWSDEGQIHLPDLKNRTSDLPLLIDFFLRMECRANGFIDKQLSKNVEEVFLNYDWPGNIRELELALKRCVWAYQSSHIINDIPETVAPLFDKHQGQYKSFRQVLEEFPRPLTFKEQERVLSLFKAQLAQKTMADYNGDAQMAREHLNLTTQEWYAWLGENLSVKVDPQKAS